MTNEDARDILKYKKSHETMMKIVETVERIQRSNRVISMGDAVLEIVWRYMREAEKEDKE